MYYFIKKICTKFWKYLPAIWLAVPLAIDKSSFNSHVNGGGQENLGQVRLTNASFDSFGSGRPELWRVPGQNGRRAMDEEWQWLNFNSISANANTNTNANTSTIANTNTNANMNTINSAAGDQSYEASLVKMVDERWTPNGSSSNDSISTFRPMQMKIQMQKKYN